MNPIIKHLLLSISKGFCHHPTTTTATTNNIIILLPSLIKASASCPHHSCGFGLQLHATALKSGCSSDVVVSNSLISMYAKSSIVHAARQVFDTMPYTDCVSWNAIINCYIQNGHPTKAFQMLTQMYLHGFLPKPELTASIISLCARMCTKHKHLMRLGCQIHALVLTDPRMQVSVFLSTALLHFYFSCGCSITALHVFNQMPIKNQVSWTSMIAGFAATRNYEMAMDCLQAMQVEGLKPNRVTLMAILSVCAELGHIKYGKQIHGYAFRHGIHSDPHCSAALIHMYCKCCEASSPAAKLIFESSTARDVVLWSSIIGCYSRHGDVAKAIKLFNQMQVEGIKPNSVTLLALLSACTSLPSLDLASEVHGFAFKSGITLDIPIGNALLNLYAKCGCLEAARQVFLEIPIKDSISWSALIGGYGLHGCGEQALQVFHDMQKAGLDADEVTFVSILSACSHAGLVEEGQKIFHHMMEASNNIRLTIEHYACYIDLLGRSGKLEDAFEVVRTMPMEASPKVLSSLISSCKIYGRLEVAELLARKLVRSEPKNAANYTLLSMIYAETGNWLGVEEVRRAMRVQCLKKCYGFSQLIQLNNETLQRG